MLFIITCIAPLKSYAASHDLVRMRGNLGSLRRTDPDAVTGITGSCDHPKTTGDGDDDDASGVRDPHAAMTPSRGEPTITRI